MMPAKVEMPIAASIAWAARNPAAVSWKAYNRALDLIRADRDANPAAWRAYDMYREECQLYAESLRIYGNVP